jgi:hypothetical protein
MHTGNSLKTSLSYDFDFSVKDYFFKMSLWELLSSSSSSLLIQISGIFFFIRFKFKNICRIFSLSWLEQLFTIKQFRLLWIPVGQSLIHIAVKQKSRVMILWPFFSIRNKKDLKNWVTLMSCYGSRSDGTLALKKQLKFSLFHSNWTLNNSGFEISVISVYIRKTWVSVMARNK